MLKSLKQFFSPDTQAEAAHAAYVALVAHSRKPWFYEKVGVADTIDGRFDVIVLHLFLAIHRLRGESSEEAGQFIRALSEVFFSDMDRSLREQGSTDTGVGMRVKKMAEAFYGRLQSYQHSVSDREGLEESLKRNLYRGQADETSLRAMAEYIERNIAVLQAQSPASLMDGTISFSD